MSGRTTSETGIGKQPQARNGPGHAVAHRGGFVLVAILILVMLVSMVSLSLMFRLRAEEQATTASTGYEQAWAVAMSGIRRAMMTAQSIPPGSLDWRNDPERFQQQLVLDDGADRWFYTIYSPGDDLFEPGVRFGLDDEASRLHLNRADETTLAKLPRLTGLRLDPLMDALDEDDETRLEGAESEFYQSTSWAYGMRNGSFKSVEELLLVRGFSPAEVYGEDANLNFILDPNEDDGDQLWPPDNANGGLNRGFKQYFTVFSYDLNRDDQGLGRLSLRDPDLTLEQAGLPEETLRYIYLTRSNGVSIAHPAELLEASRVLKDESGEEVEISSGVGPDELPVVLDQLTATNATFQVGLINVNTASAWVLQTLPGVALADAEAIVSARQGLTDERRRSMAWLVQEGLLEADVFKSVAPYLTARSFQYHFHVVAYAVPSGRYRVFEAVIDTAPDQPTISYVRDLTRLGLPFSISTETAAIP